MARFSRRFLPFKNWAYRHSRQVVTLVVVVLVAGAGIGYYLHRYLAIQEHWTQAAAAIRNYDFAAAREHLEAFVEVYPKNAEAHFLLAQVARRAPREDFALAGKQIEEAARLGWAPMEIELENALLDFQSSANPKAESLLLQTLDTRPDLKPHILEALARGCIRTFRFPIARKALDLWIKEYPEHWYAHLLRGSLNQYDSKNEKAIEDFRLVLQLHPSLPGIRRRLGMVLAESGYDFAEAQKQLEKHRQNDPQDVAALVALAHCYHGLGQLEKARDLLEQTRVAEPKNAEAQLLLALVEMDLGHDEAAMKLVRPLTPAALRFDAETALTNLLQLEPAICSPRFTQRQEMVLHIKATVLGRKGQTQEAESCRLKMRELHQGVIAMRELLNKINEHPQDVELMYQMGRLELRIGIVNEAKGWLLKALAVDPHDARIHQALAEYYESLDTPEALQQAAHHRRLARENS